MRLWARGLAYGLALDVATEELDAVPFAVQGPKSDELMARVFGDAVRDIRFFRFEVLALRGQSPIVARSGWSEQGGFEIYLDEPTLGLDLRDALWDAGHDLEVGPGCPNLIDRIERGYWNPGKRVKVETSDGPHAATVSPPPFPPPGGCATHEKIDGT